MLGVACGQPSNDGNTARDSGMFIAFANDFVGFHDWQAFDVTKDAAPGTVHPDAMLIEYLNESPPSGSTAFPVGTIIVKEGTDGPVVGRRYFAMAKRGGTFNAAGATGWEWFELENLTGGGVRVIWRGEPPLGDMYGGDPNSTCNSCHVQCGNDAVCAKAVQLAQF